MLFKWEIEALWEGGSNRSNWILLPYGIFFIIFFETFYMVTLMKNSIWEIRTYCTVASSILNFELEFVVPFFGILPINFLNFALESMPDINIQYIVCSQSSLLMRTANSTLRIDDTTRHRKPE